MTAKEYLKQGYRLDKKINSDLTELEQLRTMVSNISSPGFDEHHNPSTQTEASFVRVLEKAWKMEEKLNAEIDVLVDLKEQIRGVIDGVPDPNERMVLRYRYIHNMTWEKISEELHAGETSIRRWHRTALSHVVLPKKPIII